MIPWEPDFQITAGRMANNQERVDYLIAIIKTKEARIKNLKLRLRTIEINRTLEQHQIERQLETLGEINQHMRERAPKSLIPAETLEWMESRKLPWWKRTFKRKKRA